MRLTTFRTLAADPGPFATVVLDATSDEPKGPDEVRLRWRNLRDELAGQGADQPVLETLDAAVDDGRAPDGTGGRVLVAGSGGLLVDRFVDVPPSGSGTAAWGEVPDLLTLVSVVPEEIVAVAVHIEDAGGTVRAPGAEPEQVVGDSDGPVHKASGTAGPGEAGADARVEETWKRNTRAVADRVEKLASSSGAQQVVVTGTAPARARLLDELTPHTAELVYEVESSGGLGPDDLAATMVRAADEIRETRRARTLERWSEAVGRSDGFAVTGLADVLSAVRAQAVDTLVVDPAQVPDGEVWTAGRGEPSELAGDRAEIEALGAEATTSVPVLPALIRAVAAADGDLVLVSSGDSHDSLDPDSGDAGDDVTLAEGVGALLRFPIGPGA